MLTCMLACLLSAHPYVPVDSSLPADRVRSILTASAAGLVLAPEDADRIGETPPGTVVWESADLERVCSPPTASDASDGSDAGSSSPGAPRATAPDEAQYIIFTSGSTGTPKGVQIARSSVDRFTGWLVDLVSGHVAFEGGRQATVINQAPFSFDLSVMDLMLAWATGSRLVHIDRDHISGVLRMLDDEAEWRVHEFQLANGNPGHPAPRSPRPSPSRRTRPWRSATGRPTR
jgi:D-alanine--poly(phosphoribitol) ligase subunit 1